MRAPVRDRLTAPWVSEREIPAAKLALQAWRALRREKGRAAAAREAAAAAGDPAAALAECLAIAAWQLELASALEGRAAKEAAR